MTTAAMEGLSRAITEYRRPMSFELREEARTCEGYNDAVAGLLDTPPLDELRLETPCNWADLFKRLRHNTHLHDLNIIDCDSLLHSSLKDMADALLENTELRTLKLSIRCPTNACLADHWCELMDAIGRNRGLTTLSFASSRFCEENSAIASLAEAIARSETLVDVSVEDCDLSLTSLLLLLDGLARNETVKILRIGALREDEEVNRSMFKRVAELALGERVDCEYVLKSEWSP
ncbi:hypothetical protein MTO96_023531 [Rhipicephalus appendiculatus]